MKRAAIFAILIFVGCSSHQPIVKDAWWSEVGEGNYDCHNSKLVDFVEVSSKKLQSAFHLLQNDQARLLTSDQIATLIAPERARVWQNVYLVRALRMNPNDGSFAVVLCNDVLFVSYVAPPTDMHKKNTKRSAILVNLNQLPKKIGINAAEGID